MTDTDAIEELWAQVQPVGDAFDRCLHNGSESLAKWRAGVLSAAMAVVAEARAEALRDAWNRMNVATSGPNPDIGSFWEWLSDAAQDAEDAAEALVERLKGAIDGLAGAEVGE